MSEDPRVLLRGFADACVRCGACTQTDCGNYPPGTPTLGAMCESLLAGDETWRHFPFTCALCNRCTVHCPAGLMAIDACKPARMLVLETHDEIRALYRKFRTDLKYNLFSCLAAKNRGDITDIRYVHGTGGLGTQADATAFFPGCALYAYAPELTERVFLWLREQRIASFMFTFCCGATFYDPGFRAEFDVYRKRVQAFMAEQGVNRLVITCPHCAYELPELLEGTDVELIVLSDVLGKRSKTCDFAGTLAFHDACYDRSDGTFRSYAARLFPQARRAEMAHSGKEGLCCGGGGLVSVYAPAFCEYRRNQRLAEIDAVRSDIIVSTCFSCVNSLQRGQGTKPVRHYLEPVFGVDVDWQHVYARVDALYADPAYERLCASEELTFD